MRPCVRRLEITVLSFIKPLPILICQQKCYETLYSTQTGRDDLLFTSMIDLLFSFFTIYGWKQEDTFFRQLQYVVFMAELVCFFTLPKSTFALDKIFTILSTTAFVHVCHYSQHKMKSPWSSALCPPLQRHYRDIRQAHLKTCAWRLFLHLDVCASLCKMMYTQSLT